MRTPTKRLIRRLNVGLLTMLILISLIMASWIPEKRYRERLSIYKDTLGHNHNFSSVKVLYTGTVFIAAYGISIYRVDLSGAAESRSSTAAYAKSFADWVLSPSYYYADSIYINYCSGDTIFRQYAFSKADLGD